MFGCIVKYFLNLATLAYNIYDALFFRDRWTTPTIGKRGRRWKGVITDAMRCLVPTFLYSCPSTQTIKLCFPYAFVYMCACVCVHVC